MLLLYLYFNILLLLSYFLYLLYTVNQFSFTHFRYCVSTFSYKHMPQCKFSLYLKKAGLASRNIVHFLKKVILRCIGLCFNYHHLYLLSRLDQPLIQRIPAGLSSTVACLDITQFSWPLDQSANLKGCVSSGNLNDIFTGKTSQNGKKNLGELSMCQKLFKTAKTLQTI